MKPSRETKQKELLKQEIEKIDSFFTAETVHERVKDKNIGIATIYRFLKELKEKRKLHTYICDRKILYSKEHKSHCHFICEKCGKTHHFNLDKIDFMKSKVSGEICHFQLDISGICSSCSKR